MSTPQTQDIRKTGTSRPELRGLSEAEAALRLRRDGPNELPGRKSRGIGAIVREVMREPMFLMLIAAGVLYLTLGEPGDALLLLGFVLVVIGITVVQERRTERALEALRDLASPRAIVLREGVRRRVPGREVVRGDIVVLAEGDRVPADGLLREATHLEVDESLLTGESVAVSKRARLTAQSIERPGGENLASLYSGTLVTAGQGLFEVLATGASTEIGRIGKALARIGPEPSPLQLETGRFVRALAIAGLVACAIVVCAFALSRGGTAGAWKQGLLAGITLAMAVLPEEFPVILTVFLALGAWRIARSKVLTRRIPAIEALGSATVLCVDKTGTLTENRMAVARVLAGSLVRETASGDAPEPARRVVLEAAVAASRDAPFDPMERALHEAAGRSAGGDRGSAELLLREYPLTASRLAVVHVRQCVTGERKVYAKGAPETIAALCRLTPTAREQMAESAALLAGEGLRVLAVAVGAVGADTLPQDPEGLELAYLGLVAFADPLRQSVPAAVAECRSAGIRVIMITGDLPATATAIARQAGIASDSAPVTGVELEALDEPGLIARVQRSSVFARVVPEQKLRIVEALKAGGEIVAMTGDGVNDAPALKAAHIGIAMGGRGTDVAREAAALVLLDDAFESIVSAVRTGRRIYENIRKATAFTLAAHVPIMGLSMLPVFIPGAPLLLLPVHVAFLELIIDPACSLVFEAEPGDPGLMRRPPRSASQALFSARTVALSLLQGGSALGACLLVIALARGDHAPDAVRALAFATLVIGLLAVILVNRSWSRSALAMLRVRNPSLWWVVAGASGMLALVLCLPWLRHLFGFAPVHGDDIALSLLGGALCLGWFEVLKFTPWWRRASGTPA